MADLFDLPFEEDSDSEDEAPAAPSVPATVRERIEALKQSALARTPSSPAVGSVPRPAAESASPSVPERFSQATPGTRAAAPRTPAAPAERARRALTVSQLTAQVRDLVEAEFHEIWVEGELSNCRLWNTGHLYFTLKDSAAQIKGVIFRSSLRYLKFKPEDGLKAVARGRVSVYEPKGEYQLVCEHLEPQGFGALQLAFEQLKTRLQEEGLFDAARKRALPALPRKIGIVTSLDGAAIRDILKVLGRRHATAHIVIKSARVQGEGASVEIARGLKALGQVPGVDVIIVARGGGSIEDLWSFNEEIVARAIANCPVPVISAVGHETDVTIADFVADLRAPTPSAAAEMVIAAKAEFEARIDRLRDRLRAAAMDQLRSLGRRVQLVTARPAFAGYPGRVANRGRQVDEFGHALARAGRAAVLVRERQVQQLQRQLDTCDLGRRMGTIRTRLVGADGRIAAAMARRRHRAESQLRDCAGRLESLSPLAVLGRGYAVCWDAAHERALRDAETVTPGDRVHVTLLRGEIECEVRIASPDRPPRER